MRPSSWHVGFGARQRGYDLQQERNQQQGAPGHHIACSFRRGMVDRATGLSESARGGTVVDGFTDLELVCHFLPAFPAQPFVRLLRISRNSFGPLISLRLRSCRSSSVADGSPRRSISWPAISDAFAALLVRAPVR